MPQPLDPQDKTPPPVREGGVKSGAAPVKKSPGEAPSSPPRDGGMIGEGGSPPAPEREGGMLGEG